MDLFLDTSTSLSDADAEQVVPMCCCVLAVFVYIQCQIYLVYYIIDIDEMHTLNITKKNTALLILNPLL